MTHLKVLPTTRAIREYTSTLIQTNSFLPKVISIGDFFQRAIYTPNYTMVSSELKTIFLQQVIKNIDIQPLGLSLDFSTFLKQSEYIIRFFNELASEFKTIEDLHNADVYAHYLDHLEILSHIQKAYHDILLQNNYIDQSLLPTYYKINQDYIKQFDKIHIVQEGILSKFEQEILDNISKIVDLQVEHIQTQPPKKYNVQIVPISQKILQIAFIKQQIYQMIKIDRIEPSQIVVVLPDESFSKTLALFDNEQYFNFAMGNDISQTKIVQNIKTINKLLTNYEPKDKDKLEFFDIDIELFDFIRQNWNNNISKEQFINMFDNFCQVEISKVLIEKLNELKISLTILFFTNNINLRLKEIFKILLLKLNQITLDDTHGGKITVLGLLETRAVSFDGVIVVDFNDENIPKRSIKDKFLSSAVKDFASLPTSKNREELQKYYYTNLFNRAKKIAICYVNDEESTRSRFLSEIFFDTKDDENIYNFSDILYRETKLHHYQKDIIENIDLSSRIWSATSLKTYLECKRKYYFHYLLKIKEHNISLKPAGYELGNIIHQSIEKLTKANQLNQINLDNELSKYQNQNPYLTLELEIWKKKLTKFITIETQRQKQGYKIIETEKPFNFEYQDITLRGVIDRIDKKDNSYTILDYKTSSSLKIDTIKTYEKSCDFQLEFYYLSQQDKMIENVGYYDLNGAKIKTEIMLNEKIDILKYHLKALKTTQVNFEMCDNKNTCKYCPYKIMCQKD